MDILKLPKSDLGNSHVLVITDVLTKYMRAYAMADQKAETVAKILVNEFFSWVGAPAAILSDQGVQFTSELMDAVCHIFQVKQQFTTTYHPQADGQCEKMNQLLIDILAKTSHVRGKDWDLLLPVICLGINTSCHAVTGYTPYELVFGKKPRIPSSAESSVGEIFYAFDPDHYIHQLKQNLQQASESARAAILKFQAYSQDYYKRKHNVKEYPFREGDRVWMYHDEAIKGEAHKFVKPFWGPYLVKEVAPPNALIRLINGPVEKQKTILTHMDKLSLVHPLIAQDFHWTGDLRTAHKIVPALEDYRTGEDAFVFGRRSTAKKYKKRASQALKRGEEAPSTLRITRSPRTQKNAKKPDSGTKQGKGLLNTVPELADSGTKQGEEGLLDTVPDSAEGEDTFPSISEKGTVPEDDAFPSQETLEKPFQAGNRDQAGRHLYKDLSDPELYKPAIFDRSDPNYPSHAMLTRSKRREREEKLQLPLGTLAAHFSKENTCPISEIRIVGNLDLCIVSILDPITMSNPLAPTRHYSTFGLGRSAATGAGGGGKGPPRGNPYRVRKELASEFEADRKSSTSAEGSEGADRQEKQRLGITIIDRHLGLALTLLPLIRNVRLMRKKLFQLSATDREMDRCPTETMIFQTGSRRVVRVSLKRQDQGLFPIVTE
jgi:hypothetical protein